MHDALLYALLALVRVARVPTALLVAPGYKASLWADDTLPVPRRANCTALTSPRQAAEALQRALHAALGVAFDAAGTQRLVLARLPAPDPPAHACPMYI